MTTDVTASTSANADPDVLGLGPHVTQCNRARDPAFPVVCWLEHLHGVLRPRFVTTVFVAAALMIVLAGCG